MHGLIFFYIQKFADVVSPGTSSWQMLRSQTSTGMANYLPSGVYPDAEAVQLIESIARSTIAAAGDGPYAALAAIYFVTMLFTELMSNNAAAVLLFPIAWQTAADLGVNPMPFVMAVTVAASCGFATPMGYQTNLMIYGPGGYKFSDYLRFGGPLNLLVMAITVLLAPLIWPFR